METLDPQITAAIINSRALINSAIIIGLFLVFAALAPILFRKRELSTQKTQVDDSNGENKEKEKGPRKKFFSFFGFKLEDGEGEKPPRSDRYEPSWR